jgi:hypothetical protein
LLNPAEVVGVFGPHEGRQIGRLAPVERPEEGRLVVGVG